MKTEEDRIEARLDIRAEAKAERRAEERAERRKLLEREVNEWTDAELLKDLHATYKETVVPPCRVCGGELGLQSFGSGSTVWACSGKEDDPDREGYVRWQSGRSAADEHYNQSRFVDDRRGGDDRVIELIKRFAKEEGYQIRPGIVITQPEGNCDGSGLYAYDHDTESGRGPKLETPCPGCRACK